MITLYHVYRLFREAVMAYPITELKCNYPQTFALLQDYTTLNIANLGKTIQDYKDGVFYSRAWNATNQSASTITWQYPLVGIQHYNFEAINMQHKNGIVHHNLTVGVYDLKEEVSGGKNKCADRPIAKIETDTEKILFGVLEYIRLIEKATINGGDPNYYSKKYLDYRISEGDTVKTLAHMFIFPSGEPWYGVRAETGIEKVYGTELRIKVAVHPCNELEYNFNIVEPLIAIADCCK